MAEVVRVEFESGSTKKFVPKAFHIFNAVKMSKTAGLCTSVSEMLTEWSTGWPYLIQALLREQFPNLTIEGACALMDSYFVTHAKDPKALEKLQLALNTSLTRYVALEKQQREDEKDAVRPTQPESDSPSISSE